MAGPWKGNLPEFPGLRFDCFEQCPSTYNPDDWELPSILPDGSLGPSVLPPTAQHYVLSHIHVDHLGGLKNGDVAPIICTNITKRVLPYLMFRKEIKHWLEGARERPIFKFGSSKPRIEKGGTREGHVVDLITGLELDQTKTASLAFNEDGSSRQVNITLLDANHCFGSAMILLTSSRFNVLVMGDARVDRDYLEQLRASPPGILKPFFYEPGIISPDDLAKHGRKRLDRIVMDSSAFIGTSDMPTKAEAVAELLEIICCFPEDTVFDFNLYTPGWESILVGVWQLFGQRVRVDAYKRRLYEVVRNDPDFLEATTLDPRASRFHACHPGVWCEGCRWRAGRRVVKVEMQEIRVAGWDLEKKALLEQVHQASVPGSNVPWPTTIPCPFARHSPLPELQEFIRMFNPQTLTPNTLSHQGIEYWVLPDMFSDCMTIDAVERTRQERDLYFRNRPKPNLALLNVSAAGGSDGDPLVGSNSSAIGQSRQHQAINQLARAAGLPFNLQIAIDGLPDGDIPPAMLPQIEAALQGITRNINGLGKRGNWANRADIEEYDTDEEEEPHRRRRRGAGRSESVVRSAMVENRVKSEFETDIKVDRSKTDAEQSSAQDATAIKAQSPTTSTPRSSSQPSAQSRPQSPFLRGPRRLADSSSSITLDRAHLRRIVNAPCPDSDE